MKIFFFKILFILFLYSPNIFSQSKPNIIDSKDFRVTNAYGYLKGQRFLLNQIINDFPQLKLKVKYAELSFKNSFINAEERIVKYVLEKTAKAKLVDFEKK